MEAVRVLVADDDEAIAGIVGTYLRREGWQVASVSDGAAALNEARTGRWDLVILDVMMPRLDGFEVCRRLRAEGSSVPILFLTARAEEADQVLGLGLGGDDYVVKPFSGAALVARVKAHLRRSRERKAPETQWLRFPGMEIDLAGCTVARSGRAVTVTAKEFELLRFLASHSGRVFTREQIFRQVWGEDYLADDNTVMVHIRRLREKIEDDPSAPRYVVTVRGLGYRFMGGA